MELAFYLLLRDTEVSLSEGEIMNYFSSVDELMSHLKTERTKGERFASRFILVEGSSGWAQLIPRLSEEVDSVVRLSEFCNGPDVFPDRWLFECVLRDDLLGSPSILLIPLSECIRLDPHTSEILTMLAEFPAKKVRRIYVPLLAAEDFFVQKMRFSLRYQSGELPHQWFLRSEGKSQIIVAPFASGSERDRMVHGIKKYLSLWEQGSVEKVWLVTQFAPYLPSQQSGSTCRVRLYQSSFEFIRANLDWDELSEEWGSARLWEWLATQLGDDRDFDRLAGRLLNLSEYDADHLFSLWSTYGRSEQWLGWLWSKKCSPDGSYLDHVLRQDGSFDEFGRDVVMAILDIDSPGRFGQERRTLLQRLDISIMPIEFWERYHEIEDPLRKLGVLTDLSADERREFLVSVGKLLDEYPLSELWNYIEIGFPKLAWYMIPARTSDEFVNKYFSTYNMCRLKDSANAELTDMLETWMTDQLLWNYPTRSDVLADLRGKRARVLWVDAMGFEWTGILTQLMLQSNEIDCEVTVARTKLPTVTEFNKEWDTSYNPERGLDDIAHHYEYQMPDSFMKSMQVIEDVVPKVTSLLTQNQLVVITSDHGLSRFAATSDRRIEAPVGAEVRPPGRYAVISQQSVNHAGNAAPWVSDDGHIVLLNHMRFRGGGPCRGETHGGGTPEECLTPVIIVKKTKTASRLKFSLLTKRVRLTPKGEGVLRLQCNSRVDEVEIQVSGHRFVGQCCPEWIWSFTLTGLKAGKHTGKVYCGNRMLCETDFEVVRGIIQDDLGI